MSKNKYRPPVIIRSENFRGFIGSALKRSKNFADIFDDVRLAADVAKIIAPICKEYKVGSPITGAQCEIRHKRRELTPEDYKRPEEEWVQLMSEELLCVVVHLKTVASLQRFLQIRPTLERALKRFGYGALVLECECTPKCYEKTEPYKPLLTEPREKNDEASAEARAFAEKCGDEALRKSLLRLADTLASKKEQPPSD
jgi:hypothetical protein